MIWLSIGIGLNSKHFHGLQGGHHCLDGGYDAYLKFCFLPSMSTECVNELFDIAFAREDVVESLYFEDDDSLTVFGFTRCGKLILVETFSHGLPHGEFVSWYKCGQFRAMATKVNGVYQGAARSFGSGGSSQYHFNFLDGVLHGKSVVRDDSLHTYQCGYHMNGLLHGIFAEKTLFRYKYKQVYHNGECIGERYDDWGNGDTRRSWMSINGDDITFDDDNKYPSTVEELLIFKMKHGGYAFSDFNGTPDCTI